MKTEIPVVAGEENVGSQVAFIAFKEGELVQAGDSLIYFFAPLAHMRM